LSEKGEVMEMLRAAKHILSRLSRRYREISPRTGKHPQELLDGQLQNQAFEDLVSSLVSSVTPSPKGRVFSMVEVGTGAGKGSTMSVYSALKRGAQEFLLYSYEGDRVLAGLAKNVWRESVNVKIINEFFMQKTDIGPLILPFLSPDDRVRYEKVFASYMRRKNYLRTIPPAPVDLLFIDSVRYTHLPIIRQATRFLHPGSLVLIEEDIPDRGERGIIERFYELSNVREFQVSGSMWPFCAFHIAKSKDPSAPVQE
jgi:hypothetical protein